MQFEQGPIRGLVDPNGAFLREVAVAGEEVFRGLGFVARDANWGTPALSGSPQITADRTTRIECGGDLSTGTGDLAWSIVWTIDEGAIEGRAEWTSRGGFLTNRTGFVVLHSLSASRGQPVRVTRPDGRTETFTFPQLVSPHQPFFDIGGMAYQTSAGNRLRILFVGEVFEIEDQRNWSDASFKTYSRPLSLRFPYRISPGETQTQTVRVEFAPHSQRGHRSDGSAPIAGESSTMPLIGTSLSSGRSSNPASDALAQLALNFTAIELDPSDERAIQGIDAKLESAGPSLRIDLLPAGPQAVLGCLKTLAPKLSGRSLRGMTLWGADDALLEHARRVLGPIQVGAGSSSNFAELNRTRPLPRADYLAWASNPTVHGNTDDTIGETTEVPEDVLATIEDIAPETAFEIGPLTLASRFGPVATGPEAAEEKEPDPRQGGPIAAAWAVAALAGYLAPSVRALAFFEAFGPNGLVTLSAKMTPEGAVLRRLAGFRGSAARKLRWRHSPRARGILVEKDAHAFLCIAHCRSETIQLRLPQGDWRIERLAQGGFEPGQGVSLGTLTMEGFSVYWLSSGPAGSAGRHDRPVGEPARSVESRPANSPKASSYS